MPVTVHRQQQFSLIGRIGGNPADWAFERAGLPNQVSGFLNGAGSEPWKGPQCLDHHQPNFARLHEPRRFYSAPMTLKFLVDEHVVRPVHTDVMDLVLAVAQLDDTVDDSPRIGGQRSFGRFVSPSFRRRSSPVP